MFKSPNKESEIPELHFEVLSNSNYGYNGNSSLPAIRDGDILYIAENNAVRAISIVDKSVVWRSTAAKPYTQMVTTDKYLLFAEFPPAGASYQLLYVLDKFNGNVKGKLRFQIPVSVPLQYPQPLVYIYNKWLTYHNGNIYAAVSYDHPSSGVRDHGVFYFPLQESDLQGSSETTISLNPLLLINEHLNARTKPLFEGNTAYVYVSGANALLPPGDDPANPMFYEQKDIKVHSINLTNLQVNWTTTLQYCGSTALSDTISDGNHLYIADYSGLACLDKATGAISYERQPDPGKYEGIASEQIIYRDGKLYSTDICSLYCFDANTGRTLWSNRYKYTRNSNPVVYKDRVYLADPTGLMVFDKNTGNCIGRDTSLEIPGYRLSGYMPNFGEQFYLMGNDQITVVKLGSEK